MRRITVVGAGYVGSVTAACLAELGHHVVCADVDPARVKALLQGRAPVMEPGLNALLSKVVAAGRLSATTDVAAAVASSQVTMLAVGTPMVGQTLDFSALSRACDQVGAGLRGQSGYHVIVVRSTVVPGTTEALVRERVLQASGRQPNSLGWCMNPEFLREGSALEDARQPDRIVIGESDPRAGQMLAELYASSDCPMVRTSLRNAELIKCASNALLATLISFSNELANLCEQMPDADVDVVLQALHLDRRWSPVVGGRRVTPAILTYLRAGCGFGGSCLPKDLQALGTFAREQGSALSILEAASMANRRRPDQVIRLLERVLGSLEGATVAVFGLAFKPGTDDVRESPALAVIAELSRRGARVRAHDPVAHATLDPGVQVCGTPEEACADADAVVLVTAWPQYRELDWAALGKRMRRAVVLDGRNALAGVPLPNDLAYLRVGQAPAAAQAEVVAG